MGCWVATSIDYTRKGIHGDGVDSYIHRSSFLVLLLNFSPFRQFDSVVQFRSFILVSIVLLDPFTSTQTPSLVQLLAMFDL